MKRYFLTQYLFFLLLLCTHGYASMSSQDIKKIVANSPSWSLTRSQLANVELLLMDAYQPLKGFMNSKDYTSVLQNKRLQNGHVWPLPIVLDIPSHQVCNYNRAKWIVLRDDRYNPIALLEVEEIYKVDKFQECLALFKSADDSHPWIRRRLSKDVHYVAGRVVKGLSSTQKSNSEYQLSPDEVKTVIQTKFPNKKVIGFQTRNPLHRAHVALLKEAMKSTGRDSVVLLHPTVGPTQPGDVPANVRLHCYQAIIPMLDQRVIFSTLPLPMFMAGPREALLHAIVRKNYGCTHFIVGRDHAGPSTRMKDGKPFFDPYEAQTLVSKYSKELGIELISSKAIAYVPSLDQYLPVDSIPKGHTTLSISGSKVRRMLQNNQDVPAWFSYPRVVQILKEHYTRRGVCFYFTGLPASGKSTLCIELEKRLQSIDPHHRKTTILDGDIVRKYLTNELGFSRKDRSINVRRIGLISSLVVKHGGVCLCANIAPYADDRLANRELITRFGRYVEIHVKTPLDLCKKRDPKGLYQLAIDGKIKEFTGISAPYEAPANPEIVIINDRPLNDVMDELTDKISLYL